MAVSLLPPSAMAVWVLPAMVATAWPALSICTLQGAPAPLRPW